MLRHFSGDWVGAGGWNPATGSACAGKKLKITVQTSTAVALDFTVWGTEASPKCANLTIETKAVGPDVFEGKSNPSARFRIAKR